MSEEEFWELVGYAPDPNQQLALLENRLRALPPHDIMQFCLALRQELNRAHIQPLWAAAYIMCGAGSEEGFDCFKAWVMLQGRDYFEAALTDPDCLADIPEIDYSVCEHFLVLADHVHHDLTGEYPDYAPSPRPHLAFTDRWDFDFVEGIRESLPRLWARYGEAAAY
ncbi:MAG: DUF4240 domain-containing protein [Hyphomonadaceae bacterium]|nr:DUF4240 domain-containing protein [Hyphomonadaceae bacterium]